MKHSEKLPHLSAFISKMERDGLPPIVINTFAYYYEKVASGETGLIFDRDISCIDSKEIEDARNLKEYAAAGRRARQHAVIIVLNGGLGTSMGLTRAKSLLEVKNGKTFLEIILAQAQAQGAKLAFMNSFNTHADTLSALSRLNPPGTPLFFLQHKFPKILQGGLAPATWPKKPELEWNPPGHGDLYTALFTSGTLQSLLDEGIVYAFMSNSDNLGGTLDNSLLGYFAENRFPFMMEVAKRTPADLKGGHIAKDKNGRLILREAAQCPTEEHNAFSDIHCYSFFNTNNIWINLEFLKDLIEKQKAVRLPMILNPKTIDPRNSNSPPVYQIETAMGAAISLFDGSTAVSVPKSRFFPVKTSNDLLAVRSDCFILSEENNLIVNPDRKLDTLKVNLDPRYYGKTDMFDQRFIRGVPSLVDCESLTIEGDVLFKGKVTIKGRVVIKNTRKSQAAIEEGSIIDSDLIL